jgi:hypothetical protein
MRITISEPSSVSFRQMWRIWWRWTRYWTLAALVLGVIPLLLKAEPMAESGGHSRDFQDYLFWLPVMGVVGLVAGAVTSTVFVLVLLVFGRFAPAMAAERRVNLSGLVSGLLVGGWLLINPYTMIIAALVIFFSTLTAWLMRRQIAGLPSHQLKS